MFHFKDFILIIDDVNEEPYEDILTTISEYEIITSIQKNIITITNFKENDKIKFI